MKAVRVRPGGIRDLGAIVAVYNHYILNTPVTFDTEPFDVEERAGWFNQFAPGERHQLFVAVSNDVVVGYAHSQPLKPKGAYETSVETSVYLLPGHEGAGTGSALYGALLAALEPVDVHRAYGLIVLPNEASVALHLNHGFTPCSIFSEIGRKFGHYHDVQWFERPFPGHDPVSRP